MYFTSKVASNLSNHPFVVSLAYVTITLIAFPRTFLVNDDIAIANFMANGFDPVFFSAFLGKILIHAHRVLGGHAGLYGMFLYSVHVLSVYLVLASLRSISENRQIPGSALFATGVSYLYLYILNIASVTFTSTGILLSGHAAIYLAVCINSSKPCMRAILFGSCCVGIAVLIRQNSAIAGLLFSIPVGVLAVRRIPPRKTLLALAIPLLLLISAEAFTGNALVPKAHKQFLEFNRIRGKFHNFPIAWANLENSKLHCENGWTRNDYCLLTKWFFPYESKFTTETMLNIQNYPAFEGIEDHTREIKSKCALFGRDLTENYPAQIGLVISTILFTLVTNVRVAVYQLCYLACTIAVLMYLGLFLRLPARVCTPLVLLTTISVVFMCLADYRNPFERHLLARVSKAMALFLIPAAVVFLHFPAISDYETRSIAAKERLGRMLEYLNQNYRNNTILIQPGRFPDVCAADPIATGSAPESNANLISFGWSTFSPCFYRKIKVAFDVSKGDDLLRSLIDNRGGYIMAEDDFVSMLQVSAEENYGIRTRVVIVDEKVVPHIFQLVSDPLGAEKEPSYPLDD